MSEKSKKNKQKIIFILPHSFEPFFLRIKEDINNIRELDHFSTRYIGFMQRRSNKYEFELWTLSSKIKKPFSIMHKKGFIIHVFPRDFPSFLPLETSVSMLKDIKKRCLESTGKENIIWHVNSYYLIMSDPILWVLRKYRQKIILHHRGGGFSPKGFLYYIYKYLIMNLVTIRLGDFILVENKDEKRRLFKYYRIKNEKIFYAPNAITVPEIKESKENLRRELGLPLSTRILLYSGRLDKIKNVYAFLKELIKHMPKESEEMRGNEKNILFLIIGSGSEEKKIRSLLENYRAKNIRIIGWLQKEELMKYHKAADLFVHPNVKSEGCPNALIEVQAMGLPVAAFDIEGVRDIIINGKNGCLEKSKSMKKLSLKALELIKQDSLLRRMSINSKKQYHDNFNPEKIGDLYEKIYSK